MSKIRNVVCKNCSKVFELQPREPRRISCSEECKYILKYKCSSRFEPKKSKIKVHCSICKKELFRYENRIKLLKTKQFYCSRECQGVGYSDPNTLGGSRYYKDEIKKISAQCYMCKDDRTYLIDAHHADGNNKNNDDLNIMPLCKKCHAIMHLKFSNSSLMFSCKVLSTDQIIEKATGIKDFIKSYKGFKCATGNSRV